MCTRCDRTVYLSDKDEIHNCPVCSTPLIDAESGQLTRELGSAEPAAD